jgi:hypothetical protein
LETGNELFRIDNENCSYIRNLQFCENGKLKATIDDDVVVYDLHDLSIVSSQHTKDNEKSPIYCENDQFEKYDCLVPYPSYNVDELNGCRYMIKSGVLYRETFQDDGFKMKNAMLKNYKYDIDISFDEAVARKAKRPRYK